MAPDIRYGEIVLTIIYRTVFPVLPVPRAHLTARNFAPFSRGFF